MNLHRTRAIRPAALFLGLIAMTTACDDTPFATTAAEIQVEAMANDFGNTDINIGTDDVATVAVTNPGSEPVSVTTSIEGRDADAFAVVGGSAVTTLDPGATETLIIAFVPSTEGAKLATLTIDAEGSNRNQSVVLSGSAVRFEYTQVDRMGIPALNTVFNHASGTGPFDKELYNVRSPERDVARYSDQFEIVLGAVGNADPSATAALLLPDALPVSLGAESTSFATLTGRALSDDAVDVALQVTVGIEALHSDHVDANDVPFRATFPYVAEAH